MFKEKLASLLGEKLDWERDLPRYIRHDQNLTNEELITLRKKLASHIIDSDNPNKLIGDVLKTSDRYRGCMYSIDFAVDLLSMSEAPFKKYLREELELPEDEWYVVCQAMVRIDMDIADKLMFLEQVYEKGEKWTRFAAIDAAQYLCWENDPEIRQKTRDFLRSILPLEKDERILQEITTTLMET